MLMENLILDHLAREQIDRTEIDCLRSHLKIVWTATYGPSFGQAVLKSMLATLDDPELSSIMSEDCQVIFAKWENQLVGSAIYAERWGIVYLWGMYVLPPFQNKEVGSTIIASLKNRLKNAKSIEIRVIPKSLSAVAFYKKLKFLETGNEAFEIVRGHEITVNVMELKI